MEYLLTMTTRVPAGTSEAAVAAIRAKEATRSGELAAQGHLLRLWRPPVQPGEWRTLGLFVADDGDALEVDLASMPLRVWRTDEVTPLAPHPNDPPPSSNGAASPTRGLGGREFLTRCRSAVSTSSPAEIVDSAAAQEAERARELALQGHLQRLWRLPGEGRALGLWRADNDAELGEVLASLPWSDVRMTPLSPHPNDPAATGRPKGLAS